MASISELIKDPKVIKAALTLGAAAAGAAAGVGIHRAMAQDPSTTGDVLSGGTGAVFAGSFVNHILNSDNKPATQVYSEALTQLKKKAPEFSTLLNREGSEWGKRDLVKELKDSGKWQKLQQLYRSSGLGQLKNAILDDQGNTAADYQGYGNNLFDPTGLAWYTVNQSPIAGGLTYLGGLSALLVPKAIQFRKARREQLISKLDKPDWRKLYGVTDQQADNLKKSLRKGNGYLHALLDAGKVRAMLNRMAFQQSKATHSPIWRGILHPLQSTAEIFYRKAYNTLAQSKQKLSTLQAGTPQWHAQRTRALKAAKRLRRMNHRRHWTRTRRVI